MLRMKLETRAFDSAMPLKVHSVLDWEISVMDTPSGSAVTISSNSRTTTGRLVCSVSMARMRSMSCWRSRSRLWIFLILSSSMAICCSR